MLICICGSSIKITSIHLFLHVMLVKQMTNSDAKNNVILQCGEALLVMLPKMFQFPLIYKLVHAWKYYYILNVQLVVNKFFICMNIHPEIQKFYGTEDNSFFYGNSMRVAGYLAFSLGCEKANGNDRRDGGWWWWWTWSFEKSGEYLKQSPWGLEREKTGLGNTCYGTNGWCWKPVWTWPCIWSILLFYFFQQPSLTWS